MTIQVGDLVIMQNASYYTEWNGALGVVVSPLSLRTSMDLMHMQYFTSPSYRVKVLIQDGFIVDARPHQIRPLRDPDSDTQSASDQRLADPQKTA
jgi:hypothetical protein